MYLPTYNYLHPFPETLARVPILIQNQSHPSPILYSISNIIGSEIVWGFCKGRAMSILHNILRKRCVLHSSLVGSIEGSRYKLFVNNSLWIIAVLLVQGQRCGRLGPLGSVWIGGAARRGLSQSCRLSIIKDLNLWVSCHHCVIVRGFEIWMSRLHCTIVIFVCWQLHF